jgi:predicted RNA-binding Zn ribbon-like protein
MAYVPKKAKKGYNLEKDIESMGKRKKRKKAKAKPKEKGNWVSRLKKGVKYYLSGESMTKQAEQENREDRLKAVKAKLAKAKKKKASPKSTSRTKKTTAQLKKAGLSDKEIKKMRGN